jgi:hypothetical protein
VARFEPSAVDPQPLRDIIDSPPRAQRVQRVAEPLQVVLGSVGDDIHVDRVEVCSL